MTALRTAFEARFAKDYVKSISTQGEQGGAVKNVIKIEQAVTDVLALWPSYVRVTYDASEVLHVAVASSMVELRLLEFGATGAAVLEPKQKRVDELVVMIQNTDSNKRITPDGTSTTVHSTPDPMRPDFDDTQFIDRIVRPPTEDTIT